MFGAKVKTIAGISWVEPVLDEIQDWHAIDFDAVRERSNSILESYRNLVRDSQSRYGISPGVLEGPADIAVRLLGEQKLALELYDNSEIVDSMLAFLTAFARELAIKKLNIIPRFEGGNSLQWILASRKRCRYSGRFWSDDLTAAVSGDYTKARSHNR